MPAAGLWCWKIEHWALLALACALMVGVFWDGLIRMVEAWETEEYSHGYMLPFVAGFLVWQRSSALARLPLQRNWAGVLVTLAGLLIYIAGELGTLYTVVQYGFLVTLGGVLMAWLGWRAFWLIFPAYLLLFFTVPLPNFLYNNLSAELQLISSQIGVAVIRLFQVPVFLEGNVIDLGTYQLQVVEACSGLRYLFPLTALGYIAAVLFKGALWKKLVLFLSTIPITVFMNSFRIGMIGVLVNYGGVEQAEGFLHDFEGWVIFMACTALLVLEMWLLAKISPKPMPLAEAFAIEGPEPLPAGAERRTRPIPKSAVAVIPLLLVFLGLSLVIPDRDELIPERVDFIFFPRDIGEWRGRNDRLEQRFIDTLKLNDYLLVDYRNASGDSVNLYIAYYASQRKGASVHSPKTCLPGGGWQIKEFSQREVPGADVAGEPLRVNRSLIQIGDERLLVYYWFQQRGRVMTNEYAVKWFLLWDALTRNRTDGALVRLTTPLDVEEEAAEKDEVLADFASLIERQLGRFIPE